MRLGRLATLGGLAIVLATSPATSAVSKPTGYMLAMQLRDGDRLVGSPKLQINAGETSRIEIGEAAGNRYTMSVKATAQTDTTVLVASTIDVVAAGIHRSVSPTILVTFGKPSAIAFGEDSATAKPFRVDFTISKLG